MAESVYHLPDPTEIEALITPRTRAIMICSPNNPTGSALVSEHALDICRSTRALVLWMPALQARAVLDGRDFVAGEDVAAFLAEVVPETRLLAEMTLDEAWSTRRDWVFKPATSFGSRAVYRGDKISKRKLSEIHPEAHYLAQRRIQPGAVQVDTGDGLQRMKFDVRYYLVAILFIIFDLEITFFLPWAMALDVLGMFGIAAMAVFVAELVIGYFVIWKRGALEWE